MAKGMYIGVDGVSRKVSKMYIGVKEETPIYEGKIINIDNTNISEYFRITNGTYGFVWNDTDNAFSSNNGGVHSSTATSTWTALQDLNNVSFSYSYSSEASCDKFTLTISGTTIENAVSGATTIKSWSGNIAYGESIVLTYKKDSSVNKNDDKCKIYDIIYDTKKLIGTEIKQLARNVKKAYIGVNGIAKRIFPYYSILERINIEPQLSVARNNLSATTINNYALFSGGKDDSYHSTVDAYDTSLTRTTPTSLSVARIGFAATTINNYALFGGGYDGSTRTSTVDAYDTSLTRTTPTSLSVARNNLSATTINNYALFGGGYDGSYYSTVDAYDTSLTRTTPTSLSQARGGLSATTINNYALFGGGINRGSYYSTVDAYDTSLTRTTPTSLSQARGYLSATTINNYALFGGGWIGLSTSTVDAYDTSLTRTTPTSLSQARGYLSATTINNYALFGGGGYNDNNYSTVDAYDTSLTRTTPTSLSVARNNLSATTINNYALFGGGQTYDSSTGYKTYCTNIDVYKYD